MAVAQSILHYFLHLIAPLLVALIAFRSNWLRAYAMLLLTMAVDLDHLLADPIFVPCRCSIGFHPLHSLPAVLFYLAMLVHPRTRIIGIGLLMHMATDGIDCLLSTGFC